MLSNSRLHKFDIGLRALLAAWSSALETLGGALPQHCVLCAAPSGNVALCEGCMQTLPPIHDACPSCALPTTGGIVCGACLSHPPPHSRTVAALAYAFPADRLVRRFKYGHDLSLARTLGGMLETRVRQGYEVHRLPDAIVPMPLSTARQRERGFNQACEIARPIARGLGRPMLHALVRRRDGPAQASLPRARRGANVRDAFATERPVLGLRLAIVDDVMTTGATIAAAARACLQAGAREVDAWVVARTLPPGRS